MPCIEQPTSGGVTGALKFKGSTDCSANPNYPSAVAGDAYIVSVAGKIGGASGTTVEAGDLFIASADNAGGTQASVGTSWVVTQANVVLGTGVATFLATPTSANLLAAVTDETGTGALVFATSPTLVTPALGVATATSLNGNTFTTGTYTLTGTSGKTLTFSNTLTLAGTDSTTLTFPSTSATIARTDAAQTFTGTQTFSGAVPITDATAATSTTTGALKVTGGISSQNQMVAPEMIAQYWRAANNGGDRIGIIGGNAIFFTFGSSDVVTMNGSSLTATGINLVCATAGKGLQLKSGTGARAGNAVLVGGTVTVTNTTVTANSIIYCGRKTAGGTLGQSLSYTVSAGTSFTITSVDATGVLSALDTSTVSFIIVELN